MKTNITSIELRQIVKELKYIEGGRVDKIYHPAKKHLIVQLHSSGKGKVILRILVGKIMFRTETKPEAKEPDSFCSYLRKNLAGTRISRFGQLNNERIVFFEFDNIGKRLYVELFGRGNVILCDMQDKILGLEEKQAWKDRELKKDEIYRYPRKDNDFETTNSEQLKFISETAEKEIVRIIAMDLGLGGSYAEEACSVADVDKKSMKISDNEAARLVQAIHEIIERKPEPAIVKQKESIIDVTLFPLKVYEGLDFQGMPSYNEALDKIYSEQLTDFEEMEKMEKYSEQVKKAQTVVDEQKKSIAEMKKKYELNQKIAEKIYENYQIVSEILEELKKAKKKFPLQEINEKLKGHKIVKRVTKDWKVAVELE
jgi:predicted ribosome quality control (RQC) complex YloA/Tae2 family protein